MHYKHPVAAQDWKTNKEVWTWKVDWPIWRTSTYKRPFTQEGNYLTHFVLQADNIQNKTLFVYVSILSQQTLKIYFYILIALADGYATS